MQCEGKLKLRSHNTSYCLIEVVTKAGLTVDGFMSQISEKWQPPCLSGNLKLIRYKCALTPALVKFSLTKSYFHFFY